MKYAIKEVFATLQGEGANAGTPAVFVRFMGCNLWSGFDADRAAAAARGRPCAAWCDTDFRPPGEGRWTADEVAARVASHRLGLVVFTGGEPLLQLDQHLVDSVRHRGGGPRIAVETNGTQPLTVEVDYVTVSPKVPCAELELVDGDELRVVVPAFDPGAYEPIAHRFRHRFVSPQASTMSVGRSVIDHDATQRAIRYCMTHPRWRLSTQQHKFLGLP